MPIDHDSAEKVLHELMSDHADQVVDIALATRKFVHKTAKSSGHQCGELVYCGYCVSNVFSFSGKLGQAFIHIAIYSGHVNLGFNYGVSLPDPKEILEGTGKVIRHVRLSSIADLKSRPVKDLVKSAVLQGIEMANNKNGIQEPEFVIKKK